MQLLWGNDDVIFLDGLQDVEPPNSYIDDADLQLTICYSGVGYEGVITNVTAASPIVVTSANHGLSNGDQIVIRKVHGILESWGVHTVANKTTNTFELSGTTGTGTFTDTSATTDPPKWYRTVEGLVQLDFACINAATGRYSVIKPGSSFMRKQVRYKGMIEASNVAYANDLNFWLDVDLVDRTG